MLGLPRLIEAARLVAADAAPDDYSAYLMFLRLYQQVDAPHGWTVELHACQRPEDKANNWYAAETEARAAVETIYQLGETIGTWRRSFPAQDAEASNQAQQSASSRSRRTRARHP